METPSHQEWILWYLRSPWAPAGRPADDLDPAALAQLALAQGVAPLLYSRVRGQGVLSPDAEEPLRQAYYTNAARNLRLFQQLEVILGQLTAAGTAVILLKGAALAHAVYGNPTLRPMGDVDLLVHPKDVDAALQALAGLGYVPLQHEPAPGSLRTYENELLLGRDSGVAPLELHWGFFDSPYYQHHLAMDWFWQTAIPLTIGKTGALALGPEAQVIHLCAHLVLHHGGTAEPRLLWLHDVAEAIVCYQGRLDWETLLAQAQQCELIFPLQRVLPRLADGWRAPIPPHVLEQLARLRPSAGEARVLAQLSAPYRPPARRLWHDVQTTPGWLRRLHLAWVNLFPTPAYMRQRYRIRHWLLVPLYYPYRWFLGLRGLFPRRE